MRQVGTEQVGTAQVGTAQVGTAQVYGKAKVSPQNVFSVVKATGGKVQGYQIRPDLPWLFPKPNQSA
ncbi:helix-turn-helix domain-containing protein [Salmonella enterica subsp. enterica]|nr:helix-turn-helix domain-containing protein [Salmonella enterica subsp. enterica]